MTRYFTSKPYVVRNSPQMSSPRRMNIYLKPLKDIVGGRFRSDNSPASSGSSYESVQECDDGSKSIINEVLYNRGGIYEIELHQLVFNIDVYAIKHNGEKLTEFEYTPDHHGVYSETLSSSVQELAEAREIEAIADMYQGEIMPRYNRAEPVEIADDTQSTIRSAIDMIGEKSNNIHELVDFTRQDPARNETDFGDTIRLENYPERFDNDMFDRQNKNKENDGC